ncbi:MAG: glycoside hydrolase family 71/99 protein, partial [Thermoguttaceae bacterium]
EFPDRVPLLGCYNDPPTMDREIAAAASHGVDFFSILWYYPKPDSKSETQAHWLNRGLDCFVASPKARSMHFMIEYCNAPGFDATTDDQWGQCIQTWLAAMKHPSYLRVDGRLVFKVHGADWFLKTHDRDLARCRQRLDQLRAAARSAGLGEMLIGGGIMSRSQVVPGSLVAQLFDFTATYMSVPGVEPVPTEYPYSQLAAEARAARPLHAEDPTCWMPYLAAGWNPRPWTHPEAEPHHRTFFTFPTRAEWQAELQSIQADIARYPRLGLPRRDGSCQPAFTIYAWNEFGEGGIVAPTQGDGQMKLQAIQEVFANQAKAQETSRP